MRFAAAIAGIASTAHRLLVAQQLQGQKPAKPGESAPPPVGRGCARCPLQVTSAVVCMMQGGTWPPNPLLVTRFWLGCAWQLF